ncbi:MAG: hypothetical protein HDQ87_10370 [Clostridia bacterium]|nr:hypothetical protein [Clostridia bacterium]
MAEQIRMYFPADTGYIGTIRLALSGIAGHLNFRINEIEDIKSCIAEACLLLMNGQRCRGLDITVDPGADLTVTVRGEHVEPDMETDFEDFNDEFSRIMIESLSDESSFAEENGLLTEVAFVKQRTESAEQEQ